MMRSISKTALSAALLVSILSVCSAANAAERTLAGIKIFSPIRVVLDTYGDPSFFTSGTTVTEVEYTPERPTITEPGANSFGPSLPTTDSAMPDAGQAGTADTFDPLYANGSRYYYNLPKKGLIYEFVSTSAGRVVEIKVYGYHGRIRTSLGIGLGSTYAQIVLKYGYPESTVNTNGSYGDVLTLDYTEKYHVAFRLVRNRLAAISVVAPD